MIDLKKTDPNNIAEIYNKLDGFIVCDLGTVIEREEEHLDEEIKKFSQKNNKDKNKRKIVDMLGLAKKSLDFLKKMQNEFPSSREFYKFLESNKEKNTNEKILENYTFIMEVIHDMRNYMKDFINNYELYFSTLYQSCDYEYQYSNLSKERIDRIWNFLINIKL